VKIQPKTQSEIEQQFLARLAAVERGEKKEREAYGLARDWVMELDGTPFLFHPLTRTWLCYDKAHEEWIDLGIGPGEAILVSVAGVTGAKRLAPDPSEPKSLEERVRDLPMWFMSLTNERLVGPHHESRLEKTVAGDDLLWSASMTSWTKADEIISTASSSAVTSNEPDTSYCAGCGCRLRSVDRFCSRCGNQAR
jgi:hypothetical protein